MLFVASAGNSGTNNDTTATYPAAYSTVAPNVLAVAASNNVDGLWSGSNFGSLSVQLAAPGVNILSTVPVNAYQYLTGTSMAAPHVTGAAALVLSKCTLTTPALKADLVSTVDLLPGLLGKVSSAGRLNVNAALRACVPDFSITASPGLQINTIGSTTPYTINVTAIGGFSGNVVLTVAGLPTGATATFSPTSISGSGTSTMTVTTTASTPPGAYSLVVTGTSGSTSHSTPGLALNVAGSTSTTTVTSTS